MNLNPATSRRLTPELFATIAVVVAYIVWVLFLPAWPSQDGPVHLYYAHVLGKLLSHQPTPYARFYFIKHLLPPYALYYYALLALSKIVPLVLADKLIVCVYVLLFVFGFRYLAQTAGPSGNLMALVATPLVLNWSIGMGFVNFCFALALVLWAMGVWLRLRDVQVLRRVVFLLLVVTITLTHPVALLLLLAFCGFDIVQRILWRDKEANADRAPLRMDVIVLAIAGSAVLYVWLFTATHPLQQSQVAAQGFISSVREHLFAMLRLHDLQLLVGWSAPVVFYRIALLAIPLIGLALALIQRRRNRAAHVWTAGDTWLVLSLALIAVVPLLPSDISNAYFFFERLTILLWLAPLLAASGWTPRSGKRFSAVSPGLILFALLANIALLYSGNRVLRPIARQIANAEDATADSHGALALVLEDERAPAVIREGPSWNPFYWAPVHLIRKQDAVLDNAPWLDSAIIPLGATDALPGTAVDRESTISPSHLSVALRASPEIRARVLAPVTLVFLEQPGLPAPSGLDPVLASATGSGAPWSCKLATAGWYQRCMRSSGW